MKVLFSLEIYGAFNKEVIRQEASNISVNGCDNTII